MDVPVVEGDLREIERDRALVDTDQRKLTIARGEFLAIMNQVKALPAPLRPLQRAAVRARVPEKLHYLDLAAAVALDGLGGFAPVATMRGEQRAQAGGAAGVNTMLNAQASAISPAAKVNSPAKPSGSRAARNPIPPAPSRPVTPPQPAGMSVSALIHSAIVVAIRAIANSSRPTGRHQA